jgi:hypothetical protein
MMEAVKLFELTCKAAVFPKRTASYNAGAREPLRRRPDVKVGAHVET